MEKRRTKIRLVLHAMAWEIDYLEHYFVQLKKSKYYLPKDVEITIDVTLNCSEYFIDWEKSIIPRRFFQDKFDKILPLLKDYKVIPRCKSIGPTGHLNAQKEATKKEIDYYILSTPDIIFDERLLAYYCEAIKQVKNEYFLITPQISKMWDSSWDVLVNPLYKDVPYETYLKYDNFNIIHNQNNSTQEVKLTPLPGSKFAGWFDIMNKKMYEELVPVWDEWTGYGGWDYYAMIVSDAYKNMLKGDFQQYLLEGQTIIEWTTGDLGNNLTTCYKDYLVLKEVPNRGEIFKENVIEYAKKRILELGNIK
jgi:hypothetical protein